MDRSGRLAAPLDVGTELPTRQTGSPYHLPVHDRHLSQGRLHRPLTPSPVGDSGSQPVLRHDGRFRPTVGLAPGGQV